MPSDGNFFWHCWYSGDAPRAPIVGVPATSGGRRVRGVGGGWMEGDSGIFIENVCEVGMQNLGGRLVLMLMKAVILVDEVLVVVVGVMIVVAMEVISFFEKWCLSVTEVGCLGVGFGLVGGDIFNLSGGFVAVVVEMEVDDLELEVGAIVRLV